MFTFRCTTTVEDKFSDFDEGCPSAVPFTLCVNWHRYIIHSDDFWCGVVDGGVAPFLPPPNPPISLWGQLCSLDPNPQGPDTSPHPFSTSHLILHPSFPWKNKLLCVTNTLALFLFFTYGCLAVIELRGGGINESRPNDFGASLIKY